MALAIGQGAHPKAIQERMGHASVVVTLDRYAHLFDGLDERIADGLDATWREALAAWPRPGRGPEVVSLARLGRSRRSTGVGAEGLEPPTASL